MSKRSEDPDAAYRDCPCWGCYLPLLRLILYGRTRVFALIPPLQFFSRRAKKRALHYWLNLRV
jgi:hypothetical protein